MSTEVWYCDDMDVHFSGHSSYSTEYHIVWITKYRRRILKPGLVAYLQKLFPNELRKMPGCEIVELNILSDHIHIIMIIPPKYAVSDVVGQLKQKSCHWLRKKFGWLERVYWQERVVWSPGYFVSTIGLNEKQIIKYVKFQQGQDLGQAKLAL